MSYATGEAAIATLIQSLTAWDTSNCISLANDTDNAGATVLTSGKSDKYCLLSPGEILEREYVTPDYKTVHTRWQTVVMLYVLRRPDGDSAEKRLADARQGIIGKLDGYARLSNTSGVLWALLTLGGPPEDVTTGSGQAARAFIRQEVMVEWLEETTITQND